MALNLREDEKPKEVEFFNTKEIRERTKKLRGENKSEKTVKLEELITKARSQGISETMLTILSELCFILTGEKLSSTEKVQPLTVVVPKTSSGSHNYPLNEPCLVLSNYDNNNLLCMKIDGQIGNCLPISCIRYATDDEINKFFTLLKIKK